jgi:hypothetical protein
VNISEFFPASILAHRAFWLARLDNTLNLVFLSIFFHLS